MKAPRMTPELKQDIQLLRNRCSNIVIDCRLSRAVAARDRLGHRFLRNPVRLNCLQGR